MVDRFANLLNRFEKVVNTLEKSTPAAASSSAKSSAGGVAADYQKQVVSKVQAMLDAAKDLGIPQVEKASADWCAAIKQQVGLLNAMQKCKKPTDFSFVAAPIQAFAGDAANVKQKDRKSPVNHMQCMIDGYEILFWWGFTSSGEMEEGFKDRYDGIYFYGNKVLKLDKEKDSAWFNAYSAVAKAHFEFLNERRDSGILEWKGNDDNAAEVFNSSCDAPAATPAPAQKVEEVKPVAKKAPVKAAPVKKAPIKQKQGQQWYIENYENETVVIKADEVTLTTKVNIFSCKNTVIKIEGKLSAVMMQGCKKCSLEIENIMSMVEVIKCDSTRFLATKSIKTLSVENCVEAHINLTQATKNVQIQVMACMSISVYYPRDGAPENPDDMEEGDMLSFAIPEQFTTTIQKDQRKTEELEGIDVN